MSIKKTAEIFLIIFCIFLVFPLFGQAIDMDEVNAREDFRWGVIAFNKGNYNDAIRSFERALSLKPENLDYQEWLGSALFRAGFSGASMEIWESILAGKNDPLLNNRVEIERYRQGVGRELTEPGRFVVSGIINGKTSEYNLFRRPTSINPMADGGFYMAAFGSNEVFYFDINGSLRFRINGGLEKLASPYDVHYSASTGYLYITEFNGHRIFRCSPRGTEGLRFGERGRGDGQLLGPQYITEDEKGYLYVTDYGNHRVVKFDTDGNFILSFGDAYGTFPGLREPTGIIALDGMVYVADSRNGLIAVYDYSGNFLTVLGETVLTAPEGLSAGEDGELLVVDNNKIYSFLLKTQSLDSIADLTGANVRLLKAVRDINGNILAVDFNNDMVSFLTDVSQVYTGLAIQIDRINADAFPRVLVDVTVEDPLGRSIVGLTERNFFLTELSDARYMIDNFELVHQGNQSGILHSAVLVDREPAMAAYRDDIQNAVGELYDSLPSQSSLRVVTANPLPVQTASADSGRAAIIQGAAGETSDYITGGRFDLGIRLAAADVLTGRGYKSVIYITQGKIGESAFRGYSVLDTARYLKNSGIRFYVIYVNSGESVSRELEYLCDETGGDSIYLYQPEGLHGFFEGITGKPNGSYTLQYQSRAEGDFGRRFIPFQTEVLLYNRSGRERSGYFPPANY